MQEFAVPKPKKKVKIQIKQTPVELDEQAIKLIENERQFTSQQIYNTFSKLEQHILINQQQRMKYEDEAERFFESELAINEILTRLTSISAYPDLIPDFISSNMMKLLLILLEHPNENILGEDIEVIYEFITMEIEDDSVYQKHMRYCLELADRKLFRALLKNLQKLDQNNVEQYEIVYKILRILQQMLDFSDHVANTIVDESDIMRYLADRIMPNFNIEWRVIDDNKYISSQILIELMQNSPQNRFTFTKFQGMEVLLESINPYRKTLPDNEDQKQFLKNLFNLINIMLYDESSKLEFNKLEGVKLMLMFVKNKNIVSRLALKSISYGINEQSCNLFISQSGLKYIFPILMRQGLKQKEIEEQRVLDEHCLNIIKNLVRFSKDIHFERVVFKFKEKNFQKLEKLIEMRIEYSDLINEQTDFSQDEYFQKLGEGLTVLELIDSLLVTLSARDKQIKVNLKQMIKQFKIQPKRIQKTLRRFANELPIENAQRIHIEKSVVQILPYFSE